MNTNRDKAVSFGRDGGDVRRPVFLSMSQSRMSVSYTHLTLPTNSLV